MSHVIQTLSPGGEGRDTAASPVDRQVALQMEQLQVYKQCQFILKPRPTDTQPLPAGQFISGFFDLKSDHKSTLMVVFSELPLKPLKRRRSFIAWAFWRGSSSHLNDLSLSTTRGCLFGQPLSSVCIDGALPKPVLVSPYVSKSTNKKWNLSSLRNIFSLYSHFLLQNVLIKASNYPPPTPKIVALQVKFIFIH